MGYSYIKKSVKTNHPKRKSEASYRNPSIPLQAWEKATLGIHVKNGDYNVKLTDPRKIRATTGKPMRPNSDSVGSTYNGAVVDKIIETAQKRGLKRDDALNLVAIGLEESKLGKSDSNIGRVIYNNNNTPGISPYDDMIDIYKQKQKTAQNLRLSDEAKKLQLYNGTGKIFRNTESNIRGSDMQKAYGIEIPAEGIDMNKNPLYGKQILDLKNNVLRKNPAITKALYETYNPIIYGYANGGKLGGQMTQSQPSTIKTRIDSRGNMKLTYIRK